MKRIRFWVVCAVMLLSLTALTVLSASAEDMIEEGDCGEGVRWSLNLNTGELIISGVGDMQDYGGTGGSTPWYSHRDSIRSVTVWEGVTSLGDYAFFYCRNLIEVVLPYGITEIPLNAFANCSTLNELELPASVTSIEDNAFANCSKLNKLELPASVTFIGDAAFLRCTSLTRIELPEGPLTIGNTAFGSCTSLTEMTLPAGVVSIGDQAFTGCNRLATVSLPNTLTHVGNAVFTGSPLSKVLFYGTQEEWEAVTVGSNNALLTDALIIHPGHVYDREITDYIYLKSGADCENAETYYKSCACGETGEETFTHGEPMGHTGGVATCLERAVCIICWEPYGELGEHAPNGEPSCLIDVYCTVCEDLLTAALGHEYEDQIIPPTCTEKGHTLHACIRGDDSYTDTFTEPTGHTEGVPATCTMPQTCTVCSEVLSEALGHDHRSDVTLQPTCTEPGVMTDTCTRCNDVTTRPIPPNGHTPGSEATCTEAQICTVCHECLVNKLGHNYDSVTVDPTCTDRGYDLHTCTHCDSSYLDTFVPAKGHTPGAAATCTEPQLCTVCSAVVKEEIGHNFSGTTVEPSCLGQGYSLHTCTRCSFSYTDNTVPALGHKAGASATCTAPQTCTRCSSVLTKALGHDYEDSTVAPTCTDQGYTVHTCSRCATTYTDSLLPATGHTPGTAPTCTTPQLCTVCSTVLARAQEHNYQATEVAATCMEQGYTLLTCTRCAHSYADDPVPALGHRSGAKATCTDPEICVRCSALMTDKLGHEYADTVIAPTCAEIGFTLHGCTRCSHSYADTATAPLGHTEGDWITDRIPSFGEAGRRHTECTVCGSLLERDTFLEEDETSTEPVSGETESLPETSAEETSDAPETGGCGQTIGNILVISIVLVAVFLFWFFDSRRRHR